MKTANWFNRYYENLAWADEQKVRLQNLICFQFYRLLIVCFLLNLLKIL